MTSSSGLFLRLLGNVLLDRRPGSCVPTRPEDHGLSLSDPDCRERAEGVLRSFFTGVEAGLRGDAARARAASNVTPLYHPFYWEGTAMGQSAAHLVTLRGHLSLEAGTFSATEPFAFLRVVGVGFLMSFLPRRGPRVLWRVAARFGNLGTLVHDGVGFGLGFFRWRGGIDETVRQLDALDGFERASALNGLGRSLWFRFMDRPLEGLDVLTRKATSGGPDAADSLALVGGMGLAAAFTFPGELGRGYGIADALEGTVQAAFLKGMRIALLVRHRDQAEFLDEALAAQPDDIERRGRQDLEHAIEANEATCGHPRYIELFHERCLAA